MPPTPASIRAFPIPRPTSFRGILFFFFFLSLLVSPITISIPLAIALHIATSTSSVSVALAFAAAAPLIPISTALFGTTMAFTSIFAIAAAAT